MKQRHKITCSKHQNKHRAGNGLHLGAERQSEDARGEDVRQPAGQHEGNPDVITNSLVNNKHSK